MKKVVWLAMCFMLSTPAFAQRPSWATKPTDAVLPTAVVDAPTGVREVTASSKTLISLTTKLRYTTIILLPENEEIIQKLCGDSEFWQIESDRHMAFVKPSKAGAETNLNLITSNGTVYSFLIHENSKEMPDLRVSVTAEPTLVPVKRKYVPADQYDAVQAELVAARATIESIQKQADEKLTEAKRVYPTTARFDYGVIPDIKPFFVKAIWHTQTHTFIQTDAKELPVLYEVKDGQPSLVNFGVENGTYVVPKVLDNAYLAIGKERLPFKKLAGNE